MRRAFFAFLVALASVLAPFWALAKAGAVLVPHDPGPHTLRVAASLKADPLVHEAMLIDTTVARLRAMWQRVAICEVGGDWDMVGPSYSGIGFSNATWNAYGGDRFARLAGQASVDQQILVGMKVTGGWVPDQYGCAPW